VAAKLPSAENGNWKMEAGKREPAGGLKRAGAERTDELQILVPLPGVDF
jgi:hypothetical protein